MSVEALEQRMCNLHVMEGISDVGGNTHFAKAHKDQLTGGVCQWMGDSQP
jgi:hypothetical protein